MKDKLLKTLLKLFKLKIILLKHSKESVENARNENLKSLTDKYEKRETQLATGIEALQARYCKIFIIKSITKREIMRNILMISQIFARSRVRRSLILAQSAQ